MKKNNKDITYSEEELKIKMINELEESLKQEIGNNKTILNKYINYKKKDNGLELELVYEVIEKIGTKEKINI